jgi:hypothetical protein
MRRRYRAAGCLVLGLVACLAIPATASAGGGVLQLDHFKVWTAVYAPGQVVHGSADVWIKAPKPQGRPEDGPWHAYLVPDGSREGRLPPDTIRVADVVIDPYEPSAKWTEVRVTFTVPDVAPGKYFIEVCNRRCAQNLGDLVGTPVEIARDPMHAIARSEVLALDEKLDARIYRTNSELTRRVEELTHEINKLEQTTELRLDELRDDLERERRRAASDAPSIDPVASSMVGVLLVVGLVALWRRRSTT